MLHLIIGATLMCMLIFSIEVDAHGLRSRQVLAELAAGEAAKMAAVAAAQLRYARLAARLRTMQASADQKVRALAYAPE